MAQATTCFHKPRKPGDNHNCNPLGSIAEYSSKAPRRANSSRTGFKGNEALVLRPSKAEKVPCRSQPPKGLKPEGNSGLLWGETPASHGVSPALHCASTADEHQPLVGGFRKASPSPPGGTRQAQANPMWTRGLLACTSRPPTPQARGLLAHSLKEGVVPSAGHIAPWVDLLPAHFVMEEKGATTLTCHVLPFSSISARPSLVVTRYRLSWASTQTVGSRACQSMFWR